MEVGAQGSDGRQVGDGDMDGETKRWTWKVTAAETERQGRRMGSWPEAEVQGRPAPGQPVSCAVSLCGPCGPERGGSVQIWCPQLRG